MISSILSCYILHHVCIRVCSHVCDRMSYVCMFMYARFFFLLFVYESAFIYYSYCIQKCQKCCKIVRDRVPSLKTVRERRSPAFPPHYTTASNALLASYKVAHRIAKCKEPHTISELIPTIAGESNDR